MMNTRKILMIIGGLLLVAAGTTYLMLLQADRRAMAEVTAAAIDESARPPVVDSRVGDHVTEGSRWFPLHLPLWQWRLRL
jgi:hypothetical protein